MDAFDPVPGGLLGRERTVAKPGFNRWLVPPAALAIHLCIGMAYGLSVFWNPLTKSIGITKSVVCKDMTWFDALTTTTCDWRQTDVTVIFTLAIIFLGSSAAVFGGWLERSGPRKAGVAAAVCWCVGLVVAAIGARVHQLWIMYLGGGLIGGIGLGLGYISPVSTLIKWFPDRRGMATGMAIMGFGGGAMIGAPLAVNLMNVFGSSTDVGVWQTLIVLAVIYVVFMLGGAFGYRVPPSGWVPEGWTPPPSKSMVTAKNVALKDAHKTKQFWLLWVVLCMNVSAGIGVLAVASPMLQEIFGSKLIGVAAGIQLDDGQKKAMVALGAGFASLLSLFNILGRFFWASLSDKIGRKVTYLIFFVLGIALYALSPTAAQAGSIALFVAAMGIILSMYGGGFATIPAYLADIFGTQYVSAIHGRLLTAWSVAGALGPVLVNTIRDAQISAGATGAAVYVRTLYILAGLLVIGLIANLLVRPLAETWFMKADDTSKAAQPTATATTKASAGGIGLGGFSPGVLVAWLAVGLPLAWGVYVTLGKAAVLFR